MQISPFRLDVPQADLDDLAARLARTRWAAAPPGDDWEDGVPLEHVRALLERWRDAYDWREHEAAINALPQFVTTIDGARVHFAHVRSPEPDALPLVLTHGWPSTFLEFRHAIGPLTDPRAHGGDPADAFDLVIPSIPGYALSGPVPDRGWHARRVAHAWAELMRRLGCERYGAQGGDWGSLISRELAAADPERVAGVHVNYLPTPPPPDGDLTGLDDEDRRRLALFERTQAERYAYFRLQSTRPRTLGYALGDSPAGLLAWIGEKYVEWADPAQPVDPDHVLTTVALYWLTDTAASSTWLHRAQAASGLRPARTDVPLGVAVFPHDVMLPARRLAERRYPIARWSELERGGHFGALEAPELLVADVRAFFRPLR